MMIQLYNTLTKLRATYRNIENPKKIPILAFYQLLVVDHKYISLKKTKKIHLETPLASSRPTTPTKKTKNFIIILSC